MARSLRRGAEGYREYPEGSTKPPEVDLKNIQDSRARSKGSRQVDQAYQLGEPGPQETTIDQKLGV